VLARAVGSDSRALDGCELRELHAAATVLESLAVKQAPPFGSAAIERLREANMRLRLAAGDPAAVAKADQDFHRELTARCGNARLLAVLAGVRRALQGPQARSSAAPARIWLWAAQHDAIIRALERSDHASASRRVRRHLVGALPELLAATLEPGPDADPA
jgi:GntR family transcriptional regulator, transcriptional repressor for pyruvate dehydrogenase complex